MIFEPKTKSNNSIYSQNKKHKNFISIILILLGSLATILSFFALVVYIISGGISHISADLFSISSPDSILPEILNTLYVEIIALSVSVPIGIGTAIYLTQFTHNKTFVNMVNFANEILVSIPSLLIGMFGYELFCIFFGLKCSILAGGLTMAVCVVPIIVQTTTNAILAVPKTFPAAALSLGASNLKTIFGLILPCATPAILTGIILAAGKIIGESAALLLTTGTGTKLPTANFLNHVFSSGRTLSLHLYFIAGNSNNPNYMGICFATATILLTMAFVLNNMTKILAKSFAK